MNTCVKFRDNQIRNKKSVKFNVDLVFDHRRSKCKLVQEMRFVNMCVKFRDNQIRDKKSVKPVTFDVGLCHSLCTMAFHNHLYHYSLA